MKARLSLFALLSLLAVGCGGSEPAPAPAADPAPSAEATTPKPAPAPVAAKAEAPIGDPAAGKPLYDTNCVACHQSDGKGMGGALGADFVNDATRKAKSNEELLASITDGVEGTTMIGWSGVLDEQQRKDVLAYIRAEFMK